MKQWLRFFYRHIPGKIFLFTLLRFVWLPPRSIWQHFYFEGPFSFSFQKRTIRMYNHNSSFETSIFWQGYIDEEKISINCWAQLSKYSNVIIDIGANSGYYSLISKALNPGAKVIAFEPVERIFHTLQKNVAANDFDIVCEQVAVSNRSGTAILYDYPEIHHYQASLDKESMVRKNDIISREVPIITLDEYAKRHDLYHIDLIKIDVEGHEVEVLEGASEILRKQKPSVLFEVKHDKNATKIDMLVRNLGYYYYNIDENNRPIRVNCIERSSHWNFLILNAKHKYLLHLP